MTKVKVTKLPKSEVEIEGEIETDIFEAFYQKALKRISENIEIDGFRKGKVPENILLSKIGEMKILEEMAEMALSEHYSNILEEEKIDAIGRPEIAITKLARKNPLGFKIRTAVLPEIELPKYKDLAKKVLSEITEKEKNTEVIDEEVENTILDIRKSRAPKINIKEGAEIKKGEEELPPFNDEFVRSLGPFKDIVDFKAKLKENIKLEKENKLKEKTRLKIMEKIIENTKTEIPEILIESELQKILYRMESDISAMGLKFDDYLNHLKKTKEDLRKEFRKDAESKAKFSLVINKIAVEEKIKADEEQVAKEIAHLLEHYKDADPERARMHVENVLTNEKVFQLLENQ